MKDYSQHGEQGVLAGLLPEKGRFLDIGAYDGVTFSNTYALALKGWQGICVEANPFILPSLVKAHEGHATVQVVQALVDTRPSRTLPFHWTMDGVSTCIPSHYEKWKQAGGYKGVIWLPSVNPLTLIDQLGLEDDFGHLLVDFVNVDVEGHSAEVGLAIKEKYGGGGNLVMCVEHDNRVGELVRGCAVIWQNHTNVIFRV